MEVTPQQGGEAFVAVLNADGLLGPARIMLACNPHAAPVELTMPRTGAWAPVVLSPFPSCPHASGPVPSLAEDRVILPPFGCGVWSAGA
jgi:hypothetical protein